MRCVGLIAIVCAVGATAGAQPAPSKPKRPTVYPQAVRTITPPAPVKPSSNPAFLGIKMIDSGVGCRVDGVTPGSAADDAALREHDLIYAIDGTSTPNCSTLRAQIIANTPGHVARLDVRRGADHVVLQAPLSTRAEVLHRRLVGHEMEPTELVDADDEKRSYDLAEMHGKTTIVGWFVGDRCAGCNQVFDRISDGVANRLKGSETAPVVLAISSEPQRSNMPYTVQGGVVVAQTPPTSSSVRKSWGFTTTVPLALASDATFAELAIDDPERVHFMVIDCRGVVRFVAPIAPDSDDIEAAVDEVLAAAEQAEHSRSRR